jgi:hypothetical protein
VNKEVFMPLDHQAGEAQVDFGYALAKVSGTPATAAKRIALFVRSSAPQLQTALMIWGLHA